MLETESDTAPATSTDRSDVTSIDREQIERALASVLTSAELDGASRVQAFLTYVVREYLEGRGDAIRSKTIAEDVYGRTLAQGDDPLAIVRVDAGRLRRRMSAYYERAGNEDPIRIHIDPGGYCPRFETIVASSSAEKGPVGRSSAERPFRMRWLWLAAGLLAGAVLPTLISQFSAPLAPSGPRESSAVIPVFENSDEVREALFRLSPAKLQASNLAHDARELMFPALDRSRLTAALALFDHAILLDPDYHGGHAGAAQIRSILALTTPAQADREDLLSSARASSGRAVALAPGEGWAHSAHALTAYAAGDCARGLSRSAQARRLAPDDVHVVNFDALIALFCGETQYALDTSLAWVDYTGSARRLGFGNVIAAAYFNLGEYQAAVESAFAAIRSGAPVSPLNVAYLAAAYTELEKVDAAEESLALLARAWPGYPLDAVVRNLYVDPLAPEALIDAITRAGWTRPP